MGDLLHSCNGVALTKRQINVPTGNASSRIFLTTPRYTKLFPKRREQPCPSPRTTSTVDVFALRCVLPPPPPPASKNIAGSRPMTFSRDGSRATLEEMHLHPSRALWEAHATPSPSPTPPPTLYNDYNASRLPPGYGTRQGGRRDGGGGGGRRGVGRSAPSMDNFWSPVLPESILAPAVHGSNFGDHRTLLQQQQQAGRVIVDQPVHGFPPMSRQEQLQRRAAEAPGGGRGGIDRPALRGQEYRREKKRRGGRHKCSRKPPVPSSSLMKSGSVEAQLHAQSSTEDTRRRFLGIRWPITMPGVRRGRSQSTESRDTDCGSDGGEGAWEMPMSGSDGRLWVSLEGATELGKGFGGHTAYRIKVRSIIRC